MEYHTDSIKASEGSLKMVYRLLPLYLTSLRVAIEHSSVCVFQVS